MDNVYVSLVKAIVEHQEEIMGPIAWSEARKVDGLKIENGQVKIIKDGKLVLNSLVKQYETLFGKASVEVCKDAIRSKLSDIPKANLPDILM